MIETWWRSLKHKWLFLHSLDSVITVRRLVAFYVEQHNGVLPHSAFHGQTLDEMYCGTGDAVPADLLSRAAAARRTRAEAKRSAPCEICPLLDQVGCHKPNELTRRYDLGFLPEFRKVPRITSYQVVRP